MLFHTNSRHEQAASPGNGRAPVVFLLSEMNSLIILVKLTYHLCGSTQLWRFVRRTIKTASRAASVQLEASYEIGFKL